MPHRINDASVQTNYRETVMIVDYNRSPNITEEERLASFQDSVQRALDELTQMLSDIDTPEKKGLVEKIEVVSQNTANARQRAVYSQGIAEEAQTMADSAGQAAQTAWNYADEAQGSARTANRAANNALTQVSIVEDVAGTLQWIQEHGSYVETSDTEVTTGKIYFVYNQTAQDYEPIVSPDPEKNPYAEGWYELDISDSQADFIMAHLAVTTRGLWVLPSGIGSGTTPASGEAQADSDARQGSGYKALLSSTGLMIYDGSGQLVSTFGENIIFDSSRQQVIGGQNNFILFDPDDGSITISGSNVKIGDTGKVLSDVLTDIDVSVEQTSGGADITINGDTVHLYDGGAGEDAVNVVIVPSNGMAFKNDSVDTTLTVTIYYGSTVITNQTGLTSAFGVGSYLQWKARLHGESVYTTIPSSDERLTNNGFSLALSPSDVNVQAVFVVEVIAPE